MYARHLFNMHAQHTMKRPRSHHRSRHLGQVVVLERVAEHVEEPGAPSHQRSGGTGGRGDGEEEGRTKKGGRIEGEDGEKRLFFSIKKEQKKHKNIK